MAYTDDGAYAKDLSPGGNGFDKGVMVDTGYGAEKTYGTPVAGQQYAPSDSPDVDTTMHHHVRKVLRWWDLLALGIGCIIGMWL